MEFQVFIDEALSGRFTYVEGLSGELAWLGDVAGPFVVLGDGTGTGALNLAIRRISSGRTVDVAPVELRPVRAARGIHLGRLRLVAARESDDGRVHELLCEVEPEALVRAHVVETWAQWLDARPLTPTRWTGLSLPRRRALLQVTRLMWTREEDRALLPAVIEIDGRDIAGVPDLFLALGEAFAGVGGYLGTCLDSLNDRLLDFRVPSGGTTVVLQHDTGREYVSCQAWAWSLRRRGLDGVPDRDLLTAVEAVFRARGLATVGWSR